MSEQYQRDIKSSTETEPTMVQTAVGLASAQGMAGNLDISVAERETLRRLAARVGELSSRPIEQEKARKWTAHNELESSEPLVFIDPENGWNEIIRPSDLQCRNPMMRMWEMALRKEIFWAEQMQDDRVIEPFFNIPHVYSDSGWGLIETIHGDPGHGESYSWDAPITDYETDLAKLSMPRIDIDWNATRAVVALAQEVFDGLLGVRLRTSWWWTLGMTWEFIKLRGLTNFMLDMYDNPDGVHRLMRFLADGTLHKLEYLESHDLLSLNTEGTYVGSGGFGWTKSLPQADFDPAHVRTIDMWGFGESQETVGVSPDMFAEFILPYQIEVLSRFGLNCYGCCEPIDPRWEYVKTIPRLRRISSSPWADRRVMAEQLGNRYILSVKPNPSFLAQPGAPGGGGKGRDQTDPRCHTQLHCRAYHERQPYTRRQSRQRSAMGTHRTPGDRKNVMANWAGRFFLAARSWSIASVYDRSIGKNVTQSHWKKHLALPCTTCRTESWCRYFASGFPFAPSG